MAGIPERVLAKSSVDRASSNKEFELSVGTLLTAPLGPCSEAIHKRGSRKSAGLVTAKSASVYQSECGPGFRLAPTCSFIRNGCVLPRVSKAGVRLVPTNNSV